MKEATHHYGSFQDSLKAPIHRWFTYPAGYSHKLVEAKIEESNLNSSSYVADPFLGTGTTSLTAKLLGINSIGIEAHPFVYWVANTKLNLNLNVLELNEDADKVVALAESKTSVLSDGIWPELVYKCFDSENLEKLYALRTAISELNCDLTSVDFFKLALTGTLRVVTTAGAGWPYIAPSKYAERLVHRDAFEEFKKRCNMMISDVAYAQFPGLPESNHRLIHGDARGFDGYCDPESIDMILTSPPYLNNYDYADRTRLETYFWGIYDSWGDITREVRDHLMIAATTQIRINQMNGISGCPSIKQVHPEIHTELIGIITRLAELREIKPGKKTYDLMVAGYFEDILKVLKGAYNVLKPGCQFILVLGDSAPYGVHVRTDEIIGELAKATGFSEYTLEILRTRGGKWANNTQRHKVPLRESILTITK